MVAPPRCSNVAYRNRRGSWIVGRGWKISLQYWIGVHNELGWVEKKRRKSSNNELKCSVKNRNFWNWPPCYYGRQHPNRKPSHWTRHLYCFIVFIFFRIFRHPNDGWLSGPRKFSPRSFTIPDPVPIPSMSFWFHKKIYVLCFMKSKNLLYWLLKRRDTVEH